MTPQFDFEQVPLALVDPVLHEIRDREAPNYLEWFHKQFVPDIREYGIRVALIGYREGDRRRITDGMTRYLGAMLAGASSLPMLVHPERPDDKAGTFGQLQANAMRRDMEPLELAPVYVELMLLNGWSQADLARAIHVSPAQVAKVLAISKNLCPEVQAMVAAGDVVPRGAYALSKLTDIPKQIELAEKIKQGLLKVDTVEGYVTKLLGGKQRKGKSAKGILDGARFTFPGDWTWEQVSEIGRRLVDAGKRGAKMPNMPLAVALPSVLQSV
jgi:ParB/RepB/Spo0J family partition protein